MTKPITNITTIDQLVTSGFVSETYRQATKDVIDKYPLAITPTMAALAEPENPDDPIAKQFVPSPQELQQHPHERADAIGDNLKSPVKGIVHRYPDRALLKLVSVCPVYCRFCFRREMLGPQHDGNLTQEEFKVALNYLCSAIDIWEVILTGGDPLILSPRRIADITSALSAIPHIKILRWHTRVPVVMPEHITEELVAALSQTPKTVYLSIHANHPRELTKETRAACRRLADASISLISQTVLLKGINDNAVTLCALMRGFVETGIKPYYLHHPDLAPGTSHFRIPISKGQDLMRDLRRHLSGLAQPTYVLDIPGAHGKVPIGPQYICHASGQIKRVTDPSGTHHTYDDIAKHE